MASHDAGDGTNSVFRVARLDDLTEIVTLGKDSQVGIVLGLITHRGVMEEARFGCGFQPGKCVLDVRFLEARAFFG